MQLGHKVKRQGRSLGHLGGNTMSSNFQEMAGTQCWGRCLATLPQFGKELSREENKSPARSPTPPDPPSILSPILVGRWRCCLLPVNDVFCLPAGYGYGRHCLSAMPQMPCHAYLGWAMVWHGVVRKIFGEVSYFCLRRARPCY